MMIRQPLWYLLQIGVFAFVVTRDWWQGNGYLAALAGLVAVVMVMIAIACLQGLADGARMLARDGGGLLRSLFQRRRMGRLPDTQSEGRALGAVDRHPSDGAKLVGRRGIGEDIG
jgi:hypothetical protein